MLNKRLCNSIELAAVAAQQLFAVRIAFIDNMLDFLIDNRSNRFAVVTPL